MNTFLLNILLNSIDAFIMYFMIAVVILYKAKPSIKIFILGIMWGIYASICAEFFGFTVAKIIVYSTSFIIFNIFYRIKILKEAKIIETVKLFLKMIINVLAIQFSVIFAFSFYSGIKDTYEGIICQILTLLLTYFVYVVYQRETMKKIVKMTEKYEIAKIAFGVICVIILSCVFIFRYDSNEFKPYAGQVLVLISILSFFIFNVMVQIHNELGYGKIYQTYYDMFDGTVKDIRSTQHEYNNTLQKILSILNSHDIDIKVQEEIMQCINETEIDERILNLLMSRNKVLTSFICMKMVAASKKEIEIKQEVIYKEKNERIHDYYIIDMLGILIDNALDASDRNSAVYVRVEVEAERLFIEIMNAHEFIYQETIEKMGRGFTSKKSNLFEHKHGHGLRRVKKILQANGDGVVIVGNKKIEGENYIVVTIEI